MDLEKIRAAFWHDGEIGEDYAAELIKEVDILRAEIAQLSIQVVDRGESFERVTADLAAAQSRIVEAEKNACKMCVETSHGSARCGTDDDDCLVLEDGSGIGYEEAELWQSGYAHGKKEAEGEVERLKGEREYRHLAMAAIDVCESDLGILIWPTDHNDISELLDKCEDRMRAAESVRP